MPMGGVDLFTGRRRRRRSRSNKDKSSSSSLSSLDETSGGSLWKALLTVVKPVQQKQKEQHFGGDVPAPLVTSPETSCGDGDEASIEIDLRAEEFIANFYEQMRLQRIIPETDC